MSLQDVQSGATEGSGDYPGEPVNEPGQGQGVPIEQLRQDSSVWAWIEIDCYCAPEYWAVGRSPMQAFLLETGSQCALQGCLPLETVGGFQVASMAPVLQLPSPFWGQCRVTFGNALLCEGEPGLEGTRGEKLTAYRRN